jgi:hypothetical protein
MELVKSLNNNKMIEKYKINHLNQTIEFTKFENEYVMDVVMREFGWLLKPIMEQTKSFEKALDKLNWKNVKKDA